MILYFFQILDKGCLDSCRSTNHYPYYIEKTAQRELVQPSYTINILLNRYRPVGTILQYVGVVSVLVFSCRMSLWFYILICSHA